MAGNEVSDEITAQLEQLNARCGVYYENLVTGEHYEYGADTEQYAASIIKLFILAYTLQCIGEGKLRKEDEVILRREDCVPPSGVLTFLHEGLRVTVEDLYILMTVISDNTATNYLIDLLGAENINAYIRSLGLPVTTLRRKMYETEKARRGIQNTITAREVGNLLGMMYRGELVSPEASAEMLRILKNQQVEHKMPNLLRVLEDAPDIAHKTGEDDGITHDCGIVYGKEPFILCLTFNNAGVPACERTMADITARLWHRNEGRQGGNTVFSNMQDIR